VRGSQKLLPPSVSKSFCRRVGRRKACHACGIDFHGLTKKHPGCYSYTYAEHSPSTHGLLFYCGDGGKALPGSGGFGQPRQRRLTVQPGRASALIDQNQRPAIFEARTRARRFHAPFARKTLHRPASLEARGKWAMIDPRVELQTRRSMACRIGPRPALDMLFRAGSCSGHS
jgi:hypothetical protein